jgi:hypothetical protein
MWKKSRSRLTGVALPFSGGGLSWSPGSSEKEAVRDLVIELQARRALFEDVEREDEAYLNTSIREIRTMLTRTLKRLVDLSEAYRLVEHLRAACNTYLSLARDPLQGFAPRHHFQVALQALRESFRVTLGYIGEMGDLKQATDLSRKIPTEVVDRGTS